MASIQLGNTKVASNLISYCEKKAVEKSGLECSSEYAKTQFKATRELWGKTDGIQAHHVIQSFKPDEITPEMANRVGRDLAKELAKGHEALVYTHADTKHIHNHIVINSVNFEDGKKYQLHGKKAIEKVRGLSDELCKERGLSVIKEYSAEQRYHRAEYGLAKRGVMSWKDEIREVVGLEKNKANNFKEFKDNLKEKYNIELTERGKNITFTHPNGNKVRGNKLGKNYEKEVLENVIGREIERGTTEREQGTQGLTSKDKGTKRPNEELHNSSYGQGHSEPTNSVERDSSNRKHEQKDTRTDDFDIGKAKEHIRKTTRENAGNIKKILEPDARTREQAERKARELERANSEQHTERIKPIKSRGFEHER